MKVEIRPLPVDKWHKKKGKESFAQPKTVEVLYNASTGKYETGLTEEEAQSYGKKLGVDLTDTFNPTEPHPYYSQKASWVVLPNFTLIFDTDKPQEFVKWKNCRASKLVANSMKEYEEGKWPEATHVIYDENEEVDARAAKSEMRDECIMIKHKMTQEDKANMVQILSNKSVRGRSANFINVEVDDIIETKPLEFLKVAKMGKEEVDTRAKVLEALYKNVLTKEAGSIYYMGELIGMDFDAAVDWFKDPNNQKIKVRILEQVQK